MRLFQAALDTCLDSPFFGSLSVHGLHFTVYAPSRFSPQTQVSQGIPQWESNLSLLIAEKIAVASDFFAEDIAHLGALKIARFCGGAVKSPPQPAENRAIWCTQMGSCRGLPSNSPLTTPEVADEGFRKRDHYKRGLLAGRIFGVSNISKFSGLSRKWSDSPLFSTL